MAVPEAPRGEIRRRGVPVLPPRPAAPPLPQLRARAPLPLHVRRLPFLLVLGCVRRDRRPGPQPHRAGAPNGPVAVRRCVVLRRDGLRRRIRRRREAEGEDLGVDALLEVRGQGRGGGRGGEAGAGEVELCVRDGRGGEGGSSESRGGEGTVGRLALPEPDEGVQAPEIVGEHAGAGVRFLECQ